MTDEFLCMKCWKRECTYFQKQTRSADEPMTTFGFNPFSVICFIYNHLCEPDMLWLVFLFYSAMCSSGLWQSLEVLDFIHPGVYLLLTSQVSGRYPELLQTLLVVTDGQDGRLGRLEAPAATPYHTRCQQPRPVPSLRPLYVRPRRQL